MSQAGRVASTRRRFVNWLVGTSAGGLMISIFYPIGRYLIPPEAGESSATTVTLPFGPDEMAPNSGQAFRFGNRPGLLIRTQTGELRAFSAECTHLDCTVQYRGEQRDIWCACHNGVYDLRGQNVSGPPPRPLDAFQVNIVEGDVVIARTEA